jgi:hypothetical protein
VRKKQELYRWVVLYFHTSPMCKLQQRFSKNGTRNANSWAHSKWTTKLNTKFETKNRTQPSIWDSVFSILSKTAHLSTVTLRPLLSMSFETAPVCIFCMKFQLFHANDRPSRAFMLSKTVPSKYVYSPRVTWKYPEQNFYNISWNSALVAQTLNYVIYSDQLRWSSRPILKIVNQ